MIGRILAWWRDDQIVCRTVNIPARPHWCTYAVGPRRAACPPHDLYLRQATVGKYTYVLSGLVYCRHCNYWEYLHASE